MVIFLLIKKGKKIAVMTNASNSSSDFYFGHFLEAEDIPQSCMLNFFFTNLNNGFCKVALNFIYY